MGDIGRNTVPSAGTMLNNIAVQKDIPISLHHMEGHSIQLRVEAQDFANHNNVTPYNTLVDNLIGSQVNGTQFMNKSYSRATDGRNVRLWAKYQF